MACSSLAARRALLLPSSERAHPWFGPARPAHLPWRLSLSSHGAHPARIVTLSTRPPLRPWRPSQPRRPCASLYNQFRSRPSHYRHSARRLLLAPAAHVELPRCPRCRNFSGRALLCPDHQPPILVFLPLKNSRHALRPHRVREAIVGFWFDQLVIDLAGVVEPSNRRTPSLVASGLYAYCRRPSSRCLCSSIYLTLPYRRRVRRTSFFPARPRRTLNPER
jgi:hypothetical protein